MYTPLDRDYVEDTIQLHVKAIRVLNCLEKCHIENNVLVKQKGGEDAIAEFACGYSANG